MDVFFVTYPDLGGIAEIEIEHDNSSMSPGWHCEQVRLVVFAADTMLVHLLMEEAKEEFATAFYARDACRSSQGAASRLVINTSLTRLLAAHRSSSTMRRHKYGRPSPVTGVCLL